MPEGNQTRACPSLPVSRWKSGERKQINIGPGSKTPTLSLPWSPEGSGWWHIDRFIMYVYIYSYLHKIQRQLVAPPPQAEQTPVCMYRYKLLPFSCRRMRPSRAPFPPMYKLLPLPMYTSNVATLGRTPHPALHKVQREESACDTPPTPQHWSTPRLETHQWETTGAEPWSTHTPSMGESSPPSGPIPLGNGGAAPT